MLTQGIITQIISDQLYNVRIPVFETIYSGTTIVTAHMTNIPGTYIKLNIGDTVWVGFERNLADKPVILGLITQKYTENAKIGIKADTLEVSNSVTIPYDTRISNSISGYSSLKDIINSIEGWKTSQNNSRRNVFGIELDDIFNYKVGYTEYNGKKYIGQSTIHIVENVITGLVDTFSIKTSINLPINLKFTCYTKNNNELVWYDSSSLFRFKVVNQDHQVSITYTILNTEIIQPNTNWTIVYELDFGN